MRPTIKPNYETTFHRDGTVSLWDVYQQKWVRQLAKSVGNYILATLNSEERWKISGK